MDRARWDRIQKLFHDAADVPQGEQRVFLEAACGDDEELVVEVLNMLDQDAIGHSLLDRSASQSTHGLSQRPQFAQRRIHCGHLHRSTAAPGSNGRRHGSGDGHGG
jgi:hypothetical protein